MRAVSVVLAIVLAACGEGYYEPIGPDEGSGPGSGSGTGTGGGSGGGGGGGTSTGGEGGVSDDAMVRSLWDMNVAPAMGRSICTTCHTIAPNPVFGTTYDSHLAYEGVGGKLFDCASPSASLLVTKGAHPPGVAFMPGDLAVVQEWLIDWANMSSACNP